jgi:hypothetical protein
MHNAQDGPLPGVNMPTAEDRRILGISKGPPPVEAMHVGSHDG